MAAPGFEETPPSVVAGLADRVDAWFADNPDGAAVVSAATPRSLCDAVVRRHACHIAPTVRGRTVWNAVDTTRAVCPVVVTPNHYGRVESPPPTSLVLDLRRICAGDVPGPADARSGAWGDGVRMARLLQKRLNQLPGVSAPFGPAEAPWFTMLSPVPGEDVAAVAASPHVTALNDAWLPGGVRFVVPHLAGTDWLDGCVASVHRAIRERSI